ncbi:MAG TPA: hypothetical protein VF607_13065 [Verrucomicrobiae bacterium]
MMELKVTCPCGQKYKFDVDPVGGRMPFTVKCPICGVDGTAQANILLAEKYQFVPATPAGLVPEANSLPPGFQVITPAPLVAPAPATVTEPTTTPNSGGLKLNRTHTPAEVPPPANVAAATESAVNSAPALGANRPFAAVAAQAAAKKSSFGMGILGGLIGAVVGALIYFLILKYSGYQIKLMAIGVGGLAGWLAELIGKGEGSKELGVITCVFVLVGLVGAQYFYTLGIWHDLEQIDLKIAAEAYSHAMTEAQAAVQAVPTGSDAEIRAYLVSTAAKESEKIAPADISEDMVKDFRENSLPAFQKLAGGKISKAEYERQNDLKTSLTKEEKDESESTFKGVFLLFFLSKANLFALAAAVALAFKLSTNA